MSNKLTKFVGMLPGMITLYASADDPEGWITCDGRALGRVTYAALFAAIGTTWGEGNGSSTFNIPDLRGRAALNRGVAHDDISGRSMGHYGGAEDITLTENQMPLHGHAWRSNIHTETSAESSLTGGFILSDAGASLATQDAWLSTPGNPAGRQIGAAGNSEAHSNMPPYAVVNYIIKY